MSDIAREAETFLPLPPATFHILLALADEDRHGYAVIQDVAERTGEQGLIVEPRERPAPHEDDERRRYYRLTPLGMAVAKAEARRLAQLVKMARAAGFAPGRA